MNRRAWSAWCMAAMTIAVAMIWDATATWGDDWKPIPPEDLKLTSVPEAPGAPAVILYREVLRDDRTAREEDYVRVKILTEEGRKYANVEIPFIKDSGNIRSLKARSIRPDGTIVPFDGKVMEQTIVKAKGLRYLAKTLTLPDVQVGSIVEYRYTLDLNSGYVYDSKWILSQDLFTKNAKFELKQSPVFSLRWSYPQGLPPGNEQPKYEHGSVRMEGHNIPAFQEEDYMPPENALKYRVDFIYTDDPSPEKDPVKFWKQFGKKQNEGIENFANKKKAMEQAVAQTVASEDSPEVKLQKIYARVQQIRNLGYEKEKTEQEQKRDKQKDINNVEDVWKYGYGYGRQINWLFMGMARAAGFEAAPVLTSRRSEGFFNKGIMNTRDLDDNAVNVKVNGKDIYFDPGTLFTPYGELPWWETSVVALKLSKDGGDWILTPLPASSAAKVERIADLKLTSDGGLEGKVTVKYYGPEAQALRIDERNEDDTSKKKLLEGLVKEMVPVGIDIELANQPDWKSSSPAMTAEYTIKVPGWVAGVGKRVMMPVGLFSAPEKGVFDKAARVHPVYFHYPYEKSDTVNVELPLGWKLGSLAKPVDQDVKAIAYLMKVEDQNGILRFTRTIRSDLTIVNKDNYSSLRAFFQLIRTGDEEQVVLQPGAAVTEK